jgi:hypothetical protein
VLTTQAEVDVAGPQQVRALQTHLRVYLPLLAHINGSLQLKGGLLAQNEGSVYNLDTFVPRGYEDRFIGAGTFLTYGLEYTQPLWYIDDGFVLLPLYFKVLFAYGFAEALHPAQDTPGTRRYSSAGAGAGVQLRVFYALNLELRLGAAYLFDTARWAWVGR